MILHSFKIFKTFKTHCCQQHWLNLKKIMTPLMKSLKITPLLPMMVINKGGGGKNPLLSMTLG
jgi:hypothetical protein